MHVCTGTMSQYQEMEQTVYNSLFTLIKDTSVLRDYAAAALLIIQVLGWQMVRRYWHAPGDLVWRSGLC